jgi:hypothetical protein
MFISQSSKLLYNDTRKYALRHVGTINFHFDEGGAPCGLFLDPSRSDAGERWNR